METKVNRVTKIAWEKDTDNLEKKCMEYVGKYPYLQEGKYIHKKEQLYLMLQYDMSEVFIDSFFKGDENISSRDLDFIRMTAMLFGESFVMEHFYKKEWSFGQAAEFLAEKVIQKRCAGLPKLEELLQEQKWMKERFELQCEFLEVERKHSKQHFEEMLAKEMQLYEEKLNSDRMKMELQSGDLKLKLRSAEKEKGDLETALTQEKQKHQNEVDKWETERERLLNKCSELKAQLEQDGYRQDTGRGNCFQQLRRKREQQRIFREQEERNQLIHTVISDPAFSREQLEFIIHAVQSELTLLEVKQICNSKLDVKKMEMLQQYYLMQKGGRVG